ncbi:MAG: tetratricopeptide repeat protein [Candidatus Thermoplasmatota archaeon]|nr:tetratricopeptide repeat protein [Candidatus Thermoplasmatota archaeon]
MNEGGVAELLDSARSYAEAGNLLLAAEKYNEAVISAPSSATAWYGLGVVQANRGMTKEAIESFEKSHSINSKHGATAANLAVLLENTNPRRASEMARVAIDEVGEVGELVRISMLYEPTDRTEEILDSSPVEEEVVLDSSPVEEEVFVEASIAIPLDELIDAARGMLREGDAQGALDLVKPRLQGDGSNEPGLWSICGTCLSMVGNEVEAIQALEYSISIGDDAAKTHYNLAQLLRRNGRKVDAMQSLANALLSDAEHVNSLIALGEMRLEAGNSDEALSIWRRALEYDPENTISDRISDLETQDGDEESEIEQPEEAPEEEMIDVDEDSVSIEDTLANRISIAREMSESGEHVSAVNAWKLLLEEDRSSSEIWNGMADALSAAGHADRAFQCRQRANAIEDAKSRDEEIVIEEGAIDLITAGEEAQERLDNIEPTENEDVNISIEWYNRGVTLLGEEQAIEALNCFEKAIGGAPREEMSLRVKAQGGRGHALYQLGRYGDSIRSYHTAISMDPSGVTARMLYNMGSSYAALELFEDAIKCFSQSLERGLDADDNDLCRKQISRCKILAKEQSRRDSNQ